MNKPKMLVAYYSKQAPRLYKDKYGNIWYNSTTRLMLPLAIGGFSWQLQEDAS